MMNIVVKKSKMTIEKLATMTQREFLVIRKDMVTKSDLREELKHFATKDDLKHFATKDDLHNFKEEIRGDTVKILKSVEKIAAKFDVSEKEEAAHAALHHRITDQFHNHETRIKKLEARV